MRGTPNRRRSPGTGAGAAPGSAVRDHGSPASWPCAALNTVRASSQVSANMETQSSERHAGTTPERPITPRVGLRPTMLLQPAGTRPEPAVSAPNAQITTTPAPATAVPELAH